MELLELGKDFYLGLGAGAALVLVDIWLIGVFCRTFLTKRYPVPDKGSAIVITGASTGIGNHAAVTLAKKGFVVYAGVRKDADRKNLEALNIPTLRPCIIDVEKEDSIDKAVKDISAALQKEGLKLAALINNAGMAQKYPVEFHPMPALRKIFEVHVFGPIYLTQKLLPLLRKSHGRIIFLSSFTAVVTIPFVGGYGGSKNALESFCDAMRLELLDHKVAVSLLQPGYVSSAIFGKITKELDEEVEVSEDIMSNYGWFLRPSKRLKDKETSKNALGPEHTTTAAIIHAITSSRPQPRYCVSKVNIFPAWFLAWVQWIMPTPVRDMIVMASC